MSAGKIGAVIQDIVSYCSKHALQNLI